MPRAAPLAVVLALFLPAVVPAAEAAVTSLAVQAPAAVLVDATFTVSGRVRALALGNVAAVGVPRSPVEITYAGEPTVFTEASLDGDFAATFTFLTPGPRTLTVVSDRGTAYEARATRSTTAAFPPGAPGTPVLDEVAYRRIAFHWSAPASDGGMPVVSYDVHRASGAAAPTRIATVTGTSWADTTVASSTLYTYHVVAVTAAARSAPSGTLQVTSAPPPTPPGPPTALAAAENLHHRVVVAWSPPADDGGARVTGYDVWRSKAGAPWAQLGSTASTSWTDTSVAPDTDHGYRVVAKNSAGRGEAAEIHLRTPAEPVSDAITARFVDFHVCYDDRQERCGTFPDGGTLHVDSDWAVRITANYVGETSAEGRPLEAVTVSGRVDADLVPVYDLRGYSFTKKTDAWGRYASPPQPMQWAPPEGVCTSATWTMSASRSGLTATDTATFTVCR